MFSTLIDRTGLRYGRLVVVERAPNKGRHVAWRCRCDCGTITEVDADSLRRGDSQSCGCGRERSHLIHGHTSRRRTSKEFAAWSTAKQRCTNQRDPRYRRYGARGIYMCEKWLHDFPAFLADMGPCPPGLTLDRIDNNGPYAPGNCRWADRLTQRRNR